MYKFTIFLILFVSLLNIAYTTHSTNICLAGKYHKSIPSPESSPEGLVGECNRWSDNNCCYQNTTKLINDHVPWYGLDLNHCSHIQKLSDECHRYFIQDTCFFECSPNVGPWIQKIEGKRFSSEKFFNVPICADYCDRWWSACKNEYTCSPNWYTGFKWVNGTSYCKNPDDCKTFIDHFSTAQQFCENVFNKSFRYTSREDKRCFTLDFKRGKNPNDKVYAMFNGATLLSPSTLYGSAFILALFTNFVTSYNEIFRFNI